MKKVLFVCTGNTCRSPMAEALFNLYTKDIDKLCASSCGIYGDGLSPISENAKAALSEIGIDFSHISAPITKEAVDDADIIVGMTANHARNIVSMFPEVADKVFTMPIDISDPYGGGIDIYRCCLKDIDEAVKIVIKNILGDNNA